MPALLGQVGGRPFFRHDKSLYEYFIKIMVKPDPASAEELA